MKEHIRYFFPLAVFILCFLNANCQDEVNLKLRHIKGVQGMDIGGGITKFGNYYQASYIHFLKDKFFIRPSLSFETGKIGMTKYDEYSLFVAFNKDVFVFREFFFLSVGLAPAIQMQNTSNEIVKLDKFYYPLGVMADITLELFVFNKVTLAATATEIYSPKDKFGAFRYLMGGGVKIYF